MRKFLLSIFASMAVLAVCPLPFSFSMCAQERKVTPVESDDEKPPSPVLHYYDKHGKQLKEPVLFLAELDTVQNVKSGPVYPLFNGYEAGFNFFDLVMKAMGQRYASVDVYGQVSLHNWFFPTLELGLGWGATKPEEGNYNYKAKPGVYVKLGCDYNFLYKSDPAYRAFVGLRAAFSSFAYDVSDVSISSDYWQLDNTFSLPSQRASAFYGQVVAGVKVKIYNNWSLGWTGRYNFKFHVNDGKNSTPWFIPGYGTNSAVSATFSVIYTFQQGKKIEHDNLTE